MNYTEEIAAQCASIGAQLLDQYDPDWSHRIEILPLNMADSCHCIVGQLYTDHACHYPEALDDKFDDPRWAAIVSQLIEAHRDLFETLQGDDLQHRYPEPFLGFDTPWPGDLENDRLLAARNYVWLQEAWIREIERRNA